MSRHYLQSIIDILIGVSLACIFFITFFHLFKTRYLDYYVTIIDTQAKVQTTEEPIEENIDKTELNGNKGKDPKIIIRDPKHSYAPVFNFIGKIFFFCIRICLLMIAVPSAFFGIFCIAGVFAGLVSSFSNIIFLYISIGCIGATLLCFFIIYLAWNAFFKTKQPLKILLSIFIAGLVLTGAGIGLTTLQVIETPVQSLDTNIVEKVYTIDDFATNTEIWVSCYGDATYEFDDTMENIVVKLYAPEELTPNMSNYLIVDDNESYSNCYNFDFSYNYNYAEFDILKKLYSDLKKGYLRDSYDPFMATSAKIYLSRETYCYIHGIGNVDEAGDVIVMNY